jgi:signal transduction histidine kinase
MPSMVENFTKSSPRDHRRDKSGELLQSLLDAIAEPMVMMDDNLKVLFANRAAEKIAKSRATTVSGASCHPLLCGSCTCCSVCPISRLSKKKGRHRFERKRGRHPERIERVELFPLSVHRHGFEGTIVRITDLTRDKQMEHHMVHSEKMSALGLLAAGIIHEINNPNSFITFNLPILRRYMERMTTALDAVIDPKHRHDWFGMDYGSFREELFSLVNNLSHGATRIETIVSTLKDVARPQLEAPAPKRADLRDVIHKAVTLCRYEVGKHARLLKVECPDPSVWLQVAPEALEQVLINLLINAAQAADKPEAWIQLKTRIPGNGDEMAVIEISDNGSGIEPSHLDRIFDPFFTTKAPGVGTGLGLTVSRNLVRQMGGRIDVQSVPGKGTTFSIFLPLSHAGDPAASWSTIGSRERGRQYSFF